MIPHPISSKGLILRGPEQVELFDCAVDPPGPNQVLVKVSACGICGSDLRPYYQGKIDTTYFGHEFSGSVIALGSDIDDFHTGDRVASGLASGCGKCAACSRGLPNYCEYSRNQFIPGGFSEYCLVTCAEGCRPLIRLPDTLDDFRGTLFEPLSCAMRIADTAKAAPGSRILVIGLGMMGLLSGLLLKKNVPEASIMGADTRKGRVETAKSLGFDQSILMGPETAAPFKDLGPSFDIVVDATGAAAVFPLAIELARLGGRVVLAGVPTDTVTLTPLPIFRKELTIVAAKGPYPYPKTNGGSLVLDVLEDPWFKWDAMVSVFPCAYAAAGFRAAAGGNRAKVLIDWRKA